MNKIQFCLVAFMVFASVYGAAGPVGAGVPAGPLHQENRFPTMLMFLTPKPDSPAMVSRGNIRASLMADYTSVHVNKQSTDWNVLIDMEMAVITPEIEFRPFERLSISAELPFVSMMDGVLDKPLADYHDAGNFPDYGRSGRPHNEYAYYIRKNGQDWFHAEKGGFHLADSTVSMKYRLIDQNRFDAALSYRIKLPVGDETKGFGSGGIDHGISLLTRTLEEPWVVYLNPGIIVLEDPDTQGADITVDAMGTLFAGVEYLYGERCSLIAQLNCFTSPFDNTGISTFDNSTVELTFGFIYKWASGVNAEFAFSEDLSGTLPDFTIHAGLTWTMGL